MRFEIYTDSDPEWRSVLNEIPAVNKDIYFLQEWYQTWLVHENSQAHCIYAELENYKFLYPFLKRRISKYDLDNVYYDIQTAYGYGGIISNKLQIPVTLQNKLNSIIDEYLFDNNIIAEFIRDHPLIDSIKRSADYSIARKNVFVLTNDLYKVPHKQARQNIAKAKALNMEILIDRDFEYIDEFIELYKKTAGRIKMAEYYWFDKDYFYKIKRKLSGLVTLIHIIFDGEIIASGLLLHYNEKASLHLTASNHNYFNFRPNDFLYYAIIQFSIDNHIGILNLGGGLSKDPNDSLFRFKSKYSDFHKEVYIGKKIINPNIYNKITTEWAKKHPELTSKYSNFFLRYQQEV